MCKSYHHSFHCNQQVVENRDVAFSLKRSILLDISRGLFYLHGHSPPIIHRDLTARNILLTRSMHAKIADLGNARMVEPQKLTKTMTKAPGTQVYMPPEATVDQPKYDAKLDMFSFGHLSLYAAIQEFPGNLLPSTYTDPNNPDNVKARSEVQRREPYMMKLYKEFGKEHPLVKLICQCMHNAPEYRPSATKAMEVLEGLDMNKNIEDPHNLHEEMNRSDMKNTLKKKEMEGQRPLPPLPPLHSLPLPPSKIPAQPSLRAMFQAKDSSSSLQMRVEQIKVSISYRNLQHWNYAAHFLHPNNVQQSQDCIRFLHNPKNSCNLKIVQFVYSVLSAFKTVWCQSAPYGPDCLACSLPAYFHHSSPTQGKGLDIEEL